MTSATAHHSAGEGRRSEPTAEGGDRGPLFEIDGLTVGTPRADLVIDVNLSLSRGETLCLVGESGCGKSITCLAAMGLIAAPVVQRSGAVRFFGRDISGLDEIEMCAIRGRDIAMIFQDATASLDPVRRVGDQVAEVLKVHLGLGRRTALARVVDLFDMVGIPDPGARVRNYPHELSGGMCQRVMIAMALACKPRLLIADEATTALDVTTQAQILRLLRELQAETDAAMIFVTHDLGVVAETADRVAVMYSGRIVEVATADDLFERPMHPYTQGLMACRLHVSARRDGRLDAIEGVVPPPSGRPEGCAFAPRCPRAQPKCAGVPPLTAQANGQLVACHFPGESR